VRSCVGLLDNTNRLLSIADLDLRQFEAAAQTVQAARPRSRCGPLVTGRQCLVRPGNPQCCPPSFGSTCPLEACISGAQDLGALYLSALAGARHLLVLLSSCCVHSLGPYRLVHTGRSGHSAQAEQVHRTLRGIEMEVMGKDEAARMIPGTAGFACSRESPWSSGQARAHVLGLEQAGRQRLGHRRPSPIGAGPLGPLGQQSDSSGRGSHRGNVRRPCCATVVSAPVGLPSIGIHFLVPRDQPAAILLCAVVQSARGSARKLRAHLAGACVVCVQVSPEPLPRGLAGLGQLLEASVLQQEGTGLEVVHPGLAAEPRARGPETASSHHPRKCPG
jgi:hypothetical protein